MQLTYRFQSYEYTPGSVQPRRSSSTVLNWRFSTPVQNGGNTPMPIASRLGREPRVINWRFQIATAK